MPLGNWTVNTTTTPHTLKVLNSEGIGSQVYSYCGGLHYFDPA